MPDSIIKSLSRRIGLDRRVNHPAEDAFTTQRRDPLLGRPLILGSLGTVSVLEFKFQTTRGVFLYRRAPWEDEADDIGTTITIRDVPAVTEDFYHFPKRNRIPPRDCRRKMWDLCLLGASKEVAEEDLFRSTGPGECYTLRPTPRSAVPLQWVHIGPRTIPDSVADMPCGSVSDVLHKLDGVMGINHRPDIPGLYDYVEHNIKLSRDFGELYARVRPQWAIMTCSQGCSFELAGEFMAQQIKRIRDGRADIETQPRAHLALYAHPRRIWDLYSNRVVPFDAARPARRDYVLYWEGFRDGIFPWTVSHSWVAENNRRPVWTNINGQKWPVPIPRDTTLEHVRVELLNMGAEYVWLDVLCLRQEYRKEDEPIRTKEWAVDVPTIGSIYRETGETFDVTDRFCVTYYNGLGLPFTTDLDILASDRHWLNRAWTLQETLPNWLPGGVTGTPLGNERDLFARATSLCAQADQPYNGGINIPLVHDMQRRSCTKELDRVAGLAHCFELVSLPTYSEAVSVESAWRKMLTHLDPLSRVNVFLRYASDSPFGAWVSVTSLMAQTPIGTPIPAGRHIGVGAVARTVKNKAYAVGPCYVSREAEEAPSLRISIEERSSPFTVKSWEAHGLVLPDVRYVMLSLLTIHPEDPQSPETLYSGGKWIIEQNPENWTTSLERMSQYWILAELVMDEQNSSPQDDGSITVIKWGVIYTGGGKCWNLTNLCTPERERSVTYLDGDEAKQRSRYADRYMEAFEKMRADGRTCTFGDK